MGTKLDPPDNDLSGSVPMNITIENKSPTTPIEVALGQTEPGVIALPTDGLVVSPGSSLTIPKAFEGGCAKMWLWGVNPKRMIWCGVVPLGGDTPILVFPDNVDSGVKVTYRGQDIPRCASATNLENFEAPKKSSDSKSPKRKLEWWWYAVLFLAILVAAYLLYVTLSGGGAVSSRKSKKMS